MREMKANRFASVLISIRNSMAWKGGTEENAVLKWVILGVILGATLGILIWLSGWIPLYSVEPYSSIGEYIFAIVPMIIIAGSMGVMFLILVRQFLISALRVKSENSIVALLFMRDFLRGAALVGAVELAALLVLSIISVAIFGGDGDVDIKWKLFEFALASLAETISPILWFSGLIFGIWKLIRREKSVVLDSPDEDASRRQVIAFLSGCLKAGISSAVAVVIVAAICAQKSSEPGLVDPKMILIFIVSAFFFGVLGRSFSSYFNSIHIRNFVVGAFVMYGAMAPVMIGQY